jgi:GNAT superfamily N-acetyltransferase
MDFHFRKAEYSDAKGIWRILEQGIQRRKADGSNQWQDGYPNPEVVQQDIEKGVGFVLMHGDEVAGYICLSINDEPVYADIEGKWLSDGDFVVYHRVVVSDDFLGKGVGKRLLEEAENFARAHKIPSLRADTNYDNAAMLHLFDTLGYNYCGEVYFRGSARKAYEKVLEGLGN